MATIKPPKSLVIYPDPERRGLTRQLRGWNEKGQSIESTVIVERPLTLYLNGQEIVTMMTIGDYPQYLAVGYLVNQNMLAPDDPIEAVEYDADLETVVVRTPKKTNYEEKLRKKTLTSGCAQGTLFGDVMEQFAAIKLDVATRIKASDIRQLLAIVNRIPSLYLSAGAIHGCVLAEGTSPLLYMEDVGRHNAVDKIAGYMRLNDLDPKGKIFYTTGRLTSEMIIKCVQMRLSILISRSGFTAWGVDLAQQAGLTLIGRAKGSSFTLLSAPERVEFDLASE